MNRIHFVACMIVAINALPALADSKKDDDKYVPLFNGRDLTGWVNVNCAPGTFFVKDGEIITTGKPTGFLRTEKQYENFIAEFEWMHVNTKEVGNSGFFVWADPLPAVGTPYTRGIEVQVLVNLFREGAATSHGDVFSIHGATCKPDRPHPKGWARCLPSEDRCKGGGEWNHYKVIAKDGIIKLHVNGKEVSGVSECRPRKGYLALESEGAECHFRNLKIQELPSSDPKPEEIAQEAEGFQNLFTGLDLSGWKADDDAKKHWTPRDWVLHYDGKGSALSTERDYSDYEVVVDLRFPKKEATTCCTFYFSTDLGQNSKLQLRADGQASIDAKTENEKVSTLKPRGQWNRLRLLRQGDTVQASLNGKQLLRATLAGKPGTGPFILHPDGEMELGNLFVREIKK